MTDKKLVIKPSFIWLPSWMCGSGLLKALRAKWDNAFLMYHLLAWDFAKANGNQEIYLVDLRIFGCTLSRGWERNAQVRLLHLRLTAAKPILPSTITLQWRHNERDGVSNRHGFHCLLNRLFGRRSKKISKFRVTVLCVRGNYRWLLDFPYYKGQ